MKSKIFFRRRFFFENFRKFSKFLKNSDFFLEIFEKIKNFENSKFFENLIFQFSNEISEFFKIFGKISKNFRRRKIFCISYCNFTSNKSIVDFLDIFRCRFFPRRRWSRLEQANLQREAAHKKKEHRSNIFSFRISNSCSRLHPAAHHCPPMQRNAWKSPKYQPKCPEYKFLKKSKNLCQHNITFLSRTLNLVNSVPVRVPEVDPTPASAAPAWG